MVIAIELDIADEKNKRRTKRRDHASKIRNNSAASMRSAQASTCTGVPMSGAGGVPLARRGYLDRPLDFNELLIAHPAATFAVRVSGESMIGLGIFPGDIAVIDRALTAQNGSVILAVLEGAFTIKILRRKGERIWLEAANPAYKPLEINESSQFEIWGVVRHAIRMLGA